MTLSPKKFDLYFTSCTAHKGVEAKEVDIVNAGLGSVKLEASSSSSQLPAEGSESRAPTDAGSYLQVVVEKHRRPPPRLPAASSPLCDDVQPTVGASGAPFVVAPLCAALQARYLAHYQQFGDAAAAMLVHGDAKCNGGACGAAGDACGADKRTAIPPAARKETSKSWKLFQDIGTESMCADGPECVEVYYLERGDGDCLTARGARPTACDRAARRGARVASAALDELLAVPRLLVALPVGLLLRVQRCVLMSTRQLIAGAVHTASEHALKPALALVHNSLLAPLLVAAGAVARGVRDVLVPLAQVLDALAEPPARLLRALRLVDVRVHCPHHERAMPL